MVDAAAYLGEAKTEGCNGELAGDGIAKQQMAIVSDSRVEGRSYQ